MSNLSDDFAKFCGDKFVKPKPQRRLKEKNTQSAEPQKTDELFQKTDELFPKTRVAQPNICPFIQLAMPKKIIKKLEK